MNLGAQLTLDPTADQPLYKQLAESITNLIDRGVVGKGEKLPATRELAGLLGLNRTTVSAAYALLESSGLIEGHVGRGSFVAHHAKGPEGSVRNWDAILPPPEPLALPGEGIEISFVNSRPSEDGFPLDAFRRLSKEVIDAPDAGDILQLGSPHGYPPLRRYLFEEAASAGIAKAGDDLIITNGCQQALDLLARMLASDGKSVVVEDPVYHGLLRVLARAGANPIPIPVDDRGLNLDVLEAALQQYRPRLLVVTPSFQNPTGVTLALERRERLIEIARRFDLIVVENDIYSELRYRGRALPTLKELDGSGNTILLRSYSKVSFPGLRVGWVIAPRAVIARLADFKQIADLHSDQLSQAVLLRFAESGELRKHLQRTCKAGPERLDAVLNACRRYLPEGATFTEPDGGMSLWIELPLPLTADSLLLKVEERGVSFLPGRYFSSRDHQRGLRISFGGLSPQQITKGIQILGQTAREELTSRKGSVNFSPFAALV